MNISISTSDIQAVASKIKCYDGKHLERYASTAINRAAKTVRGRLAKDIASELGVKQKIIRQRLQFFRKSKKEVKLWFGLNPIELDRLEKPRVQKADVIIKGIHIKNAFVTKSGKVKERKTMSRPEIEINNKVESLIKKRMPYYFREEFFKKLDEVLNWKLKTQKG